MAGASHGTALAPQSITLTGGTVQKQPLPRRQGHPQRGTHKRFDGAYMTDEHDGRSRMPLGEVAHTGDHARLHNREGLATGWGTSRIRLPLVVVSRVVSAARQNLGAVQAFPRPHRGFDDPWFGDDGQPVGLRNR